MPNPRARLWLVAYDFSPAAEAGLALAASELGEMGGGHLIVLHAFVVPDVPVAVPGLPAGAAAVGSPLDLARLVEGHLHASLEAVIADDARDWPAGVTREARVVRGPAAETVLRVAEESGAVRVIMGSHGRTGLKHLLLGSVAAKVARLAAVPVLVVKTPEP